MTDEQAAVENIINDMVHELACIAVINACAEYSAQCHKNAAKWRDAIDPASSNDRNHTRALIAAAFQAQCAIYAAKAIELRLQLL